MPLAAPTVVDVPLGSDYTITGNVAGDLLLLFKYRDGSTSTLDNVFSGGANPFSVQANNFQILGAWSHQCADSSDLTFVWQASPAPTSQWIVRFRGGTPTLGAFSVNGAASNTVNYPALTLTHTDGRSWVVGVAAHRALDGTLETAPAGMSNRFAESDATDQYAVHDTNGGATGNWPSTNVSIGGTASGWRSIVIEVIGDSAAGGGGTPVGRGDETNAALALGAVQIAAVGVALEAGAALGLGPVQIIAAGLAAEADEALGLSPRQSLPVGLALETNAALGLSAGAAGAVGLAAEADQALALAPVQQLPAGMALETDAALGLAAGAVGLANEADQALALAPVQQRPVGLALEADAAFGLSAGATGAVGLASETDIAIALVPVQLRAAGLALEIDVGLGLGGGTVGAVGLAREVDEAFALSPVQLLLAGLAIESDLALTLLDGSIVTVPAHRVWRVPAENRIHTVPAEARIYRIRP